MKRERVSSEIPEIESYSFTTRTKTGERIIFSTNLPRPDVLREFEKEDPNLARDYVFCRIGTYWLLKFKDKSGTIELKLLGNFEGAQYIARALERKNEYIPIEELIIRKKGYNPIDKHNVDDYQRVGNMSKEELALLYTNNKKIYIEEMKNIGKEGREEEGLFDVDNYTDLPSIEVREKFVNLVYKTVNDFKAAEKIKDIQKMNAAVEIMAKVKRYCWQYGLKFYINKNKKVVIKWMKRPTEDFDRLRINFLNNIKESKKEIKNVGMPKLYEHLKCLKTGATICYRPDPSLNIEWYVKV
jgi:hypothetical protein